MKFSRRKFLAALGIAIGIPLIDSLIVEPALLITKAELKLRLNIKGSMLRLVQLSDLHFGSSNPLLYSTVKSIVEGLKPDIIVITGDIVSKVEALDDAIEFLEGLERIAPILIVWGNWDHWSLGDRITKFKESLESIGEIKVLINESFVLENGVSIVGVDDPYTGHDNLDLALKGSSNIRVLLAHSPQIIDKAVNNVDLVLTGHTHGGQVVLPLIGPVFVPLPAKYRKYVSGLFKIENTVMYVSRGLGTSILPLRFSCPPEVLLVEIY